MDTKVVYDGIIRVYNQVQDATKQVGGLLDILTQSKLGEDIKETLGSGLRRIFKMNVEVTTS